MRTTKTVKILMTVLFIAAGLVVARVGILINKTFHPATAVISEGVKVDYQDSDDFDNDGLKNAEEAVWGSDPYNPDTDGDGYLDGEEVASDFNPIRTSKDGDSLAQARRILAENSTQKISGLIIGGLMSGDLKESNDSENYSASVNTLAETSVYSILSALESSDIPDNPEKVAEPTKENEEQYVQTILSIINDKIVDLIYRQPQELVMLFSPDQALDQNSQVFSAERKEKIKTKFLQYTVVFQTAADNLQKSSVPEGWEKIHKKGISLLRKLENHYRTIALSPEDPFKQMIVLGNLQKTYLESQPIFIAISNKIKEHNLQTPDDDFFNVTLLLNQ